MDDPLRRTGRTTRMLLDVLHQAITNESDHRVIVGHIVEYAQRLKERCRKLAFDLRIDITDETRTSIRVRRTGSLGPGHVWLEFISFRQKERLRGLGDVPIHWDHYAIEVVADEEAKKCKRT